MAVVKLIAVLVLLQSSAGWTEAVVRSSIVGGDDAPKGMWPSLVYLDIKTDSGDRKWHCSGTILNENWVMTAGRCWEDELWSRWDRTGVWVGVHDLDKPAERYIKVIAVDRLPCFKAADKGFINDISLIKLNKLLNFSTMRHTSPVKLPEEDETFDSSSECWIAGWWEDQLHQTRVQKQMKVRIVSKKRCEARFPALNNRMLCAGVPADETTDCEHPPEDYGSPLMCRTARGFVQVGIMSFKSPDDCSHPEHFGIYTRVSKFLGYINARLHLD